MQKYQKKFVAAGKEVTIEMGHIGFRADVALTARQGDTVVMVFVTVDQKNTDLDYFPLGVHYIEKYYAGGKISSSPFVKRERRPSDAAVVKGRVMDRAMRPLFPAGFKRGVNVVVNVMSFDGENDPAILGANAASLAVHISSIPFFGPISTIRIGQDSTGQLLVNPNIEQAKISSLDAVISCTTDAVTQLEIEGNQIPNEQMSKVFDLAFEEAQSWNRAMEEIRGEVGKAKLEFAETKADMHLVDQIKSQYASRIEEALFDDDDRNRKLEEIRIEAVESNKTANQSRSEDEQVPDIEIINAIHYVEKSISRSYMIQGKRLSGRALDEIRQIAIEVGVLPRVHGSALFNRGITQALAITTLGSTRLAEVSESFEGESEKRYMHHYNGPSYSVGEAGRHSFYPGNREVGHGALAEKAVRPVLPSEEEFPYAIRVVSEILSQNGSTSMAATCASCLALMDAGVPIKAPVAGISIGLITSDDAQSEFKLLTDVQDIEDYYGDMDFKVAGTRDGITAIQMDTKLKGVKKQILQAALTDAYKARISILDKFSNVITQPREKLSEYAPRVENIKINPERIGELIGPGGKMIKSILESVQNKADIDIKDDGQVLITAVNLEVIQNVVEQINQIIFEPVVGQEYLGKVDKIADFGAFVKITPSVSGLVHVSEISDEFIKNVSDHLKVGQEVKVKILEPDKTGKLRMSIKRVSKM